MRHMKYLVRRAEKTDAAALNTLVNSAYRGDSSKKGWTTEADLLGGQRIDEERLIKLIDHPLKAILRMVDEKSEIIGTVSLERFEDSKGVGCYLGMLTIRPTAQTGGLGKTMMLEAEEFARKWGATRMTLGVIQLRGELMAWYERRGYKKNGEIQAFPYGDVRFGEPKRDDLHFVMFEKSLI